MAIEEKNKAIVKEEPSVISTKEDPQKVAAKVELGDKQSRKYRRDQDREKVKGIFRFYEVPGGQLSFVFRAYKEDEVEKFTLTDNNVYTLPLGVAKHLNKNGCYPIHQYLKDETGAVSMKIGQKVRRFGFQSLEFVDIDEFTSAPSEIVTVERV